MPAASAFDPEMAPADVLWDDVDRYGTGRVSEHVNAAAWLHWDEGMAAPPSNSAAAHLVGGSLDSGLATHIQAGGGGGAARDARASIQDEMARNLRAMLMAASHPNALRTDVRAVGSAAVGTGLDSSSTQWRPPSHICPRPTVLYGGEAGAQRIAPGAGAGARARPGSAQPASRGAAASPGDGGGALPSWAQRAGGPGMQRYRGQSFEPRHVAAEAALAARQQGAMAGRVEYRPPADRARPRAAAPVSAGGVAGGGGTAGPARREYRPPSAGGGAVPRGILKRPSSAPMTRDPAPVPAPAMAAGVGAVRQRGPPGFGTRTGGALSQRARPATAGGFGTSTDRGFVPGAVVVTASGGRVRVAPSRGSSQGPPRRGRPASARAPGPTAMHDMSVTAKSLGGGPGSDGEAAAGLERREAHGRPEAEEPPPVRGPIWSTSAPFRREGRVSGSDAQRSLDRSRSSVSPSGRSRGWGGSASSEVDALDFEVPARLQQRAPVEVNYERYQGAAAAYAAGVAAGPPSHRGALQARPRPASASGPRAAAGAWGARGSRDSFEEYVAAHRDRASIESTEPGGGGGVAGGAGREQAPRARSRPRPYYISSSDDDDVEVAARPRARVEKQWAPPAAPPPTAATAATAAAAPTPAPARLEFGGQLPPGGEVRRQAGPAVPGGSTPDDIARSRREREKRARVKARERAARAEQRMLESMRGAPLGPGVAAWRAPADESFLAPPAWNPRVAPKEGPGASHDAWLPAPSSSPAHGRGRSRPEGPHSLPMAAEGEWPEPTTRAAAEAVEAEAAAPPPLGVVSRCGNPFEEELMRLAAARQSLEGQGAGAGGKGDVPASTPAGAEVDVDMDVDVGGISERLQQTWPGGGGLEELRAEQERREAERQAEVQSTRDHMIQEHRRRQEQERSIAPAPAHSSSSSSSSEAKEKFARDLARLMDGTSELERRVAEEYYPPAQPSTHPSAHPPAYPSAHPSAHTPAHVYASPAPIPVGGAGTAAGPPPSPSAAAEEADSLAGDSVDDSVEAGYDSGDGGEGLGCAGRGGSEDPHGETWELEDRVRREYEEWAALYRRGAAA